MVVKQHSKEPSFGLCKWMYTYELCISVQLHPVSGISSAPTFSPRLATPNFRSWRYSHLLQHIFVSCLVSALQKPKMQDGGALSCWAPEQSGWGAVAKAGTWHTLGGQFGLHGPARPSRGMWYLCSLSQSCCWSGPGTPCTFAQHLAHSGSRAGPTAALSHWVSSFQQQ